MLTNYSEILTVINVKWQKSESVIEAIILNQIIQVEGTPFHAQNMHVIDYCSQLNISLSIIRKTKIIF